MQTSDADNQEKACKYMSALHTAGRAIGMGWSVEHYNQYRKTAHVSKTARMQLYFANV